MFFLSSCFLLLFQNSNSDGSACCVGVIGVVILIVVVSAFTATTKAKEIENAKNAYYKSLNILKTNPTNPNLRQNTLSLGRTYSNLTRNKKGVSLFDEVALMNDINAACAGATSIIQTNVNVNQSQNRTIEARLANLDNLRNKGLIDGSEYVQRRQNILDEI